MTARLWPAACCFHDIVFVSGGTLADQTITHEVEVFDGVAWRSVCPMLKARRRHGMAAVALDSVEYYDGTWHAVYKHWMFVFAGCCRSHASMNTVERYDTVSHTWTLAAAIPEGYSSAVVWGSDIWVTGRGKYATHMDRYDILTNKWTREQDMPSSRHRPQASILHLTARTLAKR